MRALLVLSGLVKAQAAEMNSYVHCFSWLHIDLSRSTIIVAIVMVLSILALVMFMQSEVHPYDRLQRFVLMTEEDALERQSKLQKQLALMFFTIIEQCYTGNAAYERTPDLSTNVVYTSLRQIQLLGIMLDEGRLVDAERTVAYIGGDWATNEEIQNVPADLDG